MTTTATTTKKPRSKRTAVPAPEATSSTSAGLDALTGAAPPVQGVAQLVDVTRLRPHPSNPRRDLGDLTELTDSIRAHGVRQNLLLVPDPDDVGAYRLVIGHRRTAAARLAGLIQLPAVIDTGLTEAEQLELMLLENIQRTDLTAIEEGDGYQGLLDLGVSVTAIATGTGRSETTVRSRLKLRALPEAARTVVHENRATLADAADLTDLPAELAEGLAKHLGTSSFSYELHVVRQQLDLEATFADPISRLEAAGAARRSGEYWTKAAGLVEAVRVHESYMTDNDSGYAVRTREALEAAIGQATTGWAYKVASSSLQVLRPEDLEESTIEAVPDPVEAARAAAAQAELDTARAAQAARDAQLAELAEVSGQTRGAFLDRLIARKLSQAETRSIVQFAGFELMYAIWKWEEPEVAARADLVRWLDVPPIEGVDNGYDVDEATGAEVMAAVRALDPPSRLLAALAAAQEPIPAFEWSQCGYSVRTRRRVAAWYALLEDLGYGVSDAERAALTPPEPVAGES